MDDGRRPPRKLRFKPKPQKRSKGGSSAVPKTEKVDEDEEEAESRQQLFRRFERDIRLRQQPKSETQKEISFTNEARQVATTRLSDGPRLRSHKQNTGHDLMQLDDGTGESSESSCSAVGPGVHPKMETYEEPWDYNSYYLTAVPWRKPYSGDPEILNEAEFGEDASKVEYDETTINPASELGLLNPDESGENNRLLFFQLPQSLPAMKRFASAKGKEKEGSLPLPNQRGLVALGQDESFIRGATSQRTCSLDDLSAGLMGKLQVYKSGAVKLKLGDIFYNVSPGMDCTFAQEVAAIDTKKKSFCEIGGLDGRAVVTPDIDYILNMIDLD